MPRPLHRSLPSHIVPSAAPTAASSAALTAAPTTAPTAARATYCIDGCTALHSTVPQWCLMHGCTQTCARAQRTHSAARMMDEGMEAWLRGRTLACLNGRTEALTDARTDARAVGRQMHAWTHRRAGGRAGGRKDGRTNGWTGADGQMHRRMRTDGQTYWRSG